MLSLYHAPDSRSSRFIWLLEELGTPFEIVYCDIKRRSGRGAADPKNPHPDKRVPALMHGEQLVTESAAIALYLTDTFPSAGIGVLPGAPDRAAYLTWLAFYAGEADPAYTVRSIYKGRVDPASEKDHRRVAARVSSALKQGPFLLGDQFSAADIFMSGPFEWDPTLAPENTAVDEWLARLAARPAARRAAARDTPPNGASPTQAT
ncbi:MAG TPA: glutathione S-transferase [Rhizomicrobium sp.]|jgi:glutathione S-transferase|nr:glutathione S-transferase [Rhizomicrobium sp.]